MALANQFDKPDDRPTACFVCEAMLPEAVDGTLSETEQRAFDKHVAGCIECSKELAEARRGAAWLGMLKTQSPDPPAHLLARILAETTGAPAVAYQPAPVPMYTWGPLVPHPAPHSGLRAEPQPRQPFEWAAFRRQLRGFLSIQSARATFQPRMAMTAAMAFFSIALTLNLTGVRLNNLHASSFTPAAIQRSVADAGASATRMFQNNRAVYQVESRLSDLRNDDAPAARR